MVTWNSPFTEHELQLNSTSDRGAQVTYKKISYPPTHKHSFIMHGLKSNTIYEVRVRAQSFGSWANKHIKTIAGKVK